MLGINTMIETNNHIQNPFLELDELLIMDIPPQEAILDPWLIKGSASMIYAERGLGKSFFMLGLSLSITRGISFLDWQISSPQGVLYVDGEMSASLLKERFVFMTKNMPEKTKPFFIANYQLLDEDKKILNLAYPKNQIAFMHLIPEDCNVIIFDNISCLFGSVDENDAKQWDPIQQWLNQLRSLGFTIILVHHAGKNKTQRGTSKREDAQDIIIQLSSFKLPECRGACFQIGFDKARALISDNIHPKVAALCPDTGSWISMSVTEAENKHIIELYESGYTQEEIALELNTSQSSISRKTKMLKKEGLIQ